MQASFPTLSVSERATAPLSRTLFFWLSSVAFIGLATPIAANWMRGMVGFFPLVGLAILMGMSEGSFNRVLRSISRGFSDNKWLVLFSVWYLVGLYLNLFFRGSGLDDWRLALGPAVFLIAMCFAFGFMRHEDCYRLFLVGFVLAAGVQAVFSARELSSQVGIAREMWTELGGAWVFGDQGVYASWVILLPLLFWGAFRERGILRVVLLVASLLIGIAASISSFATPFVLMGLGGAVVGILVVLLPVKGQSRVVSVIIAGLLLVAGLVVYQVSYANPLFDPVYSRIENVLLDPASGGYSGAALAVSRMSLAEISFNSFVEEPLWGEGGGSIRYSQFVGGHSSFLDALGAYGLFGGGGALAGMMLVMLATAVIRFWNERNWETLLALTSVVVLGVAGVVNPYWEGWQPTLVLIMARPFLPIVKNQANDLIVGKTFSQLSRPNSS